MGKRIYWGMAIAMTAALAGIAACGGGDDSKVEQADSGSVDGAVVDATAADANAKDAANVDSGETDASGDSGAEAGCTNVSAAVISHITALSTTGWSALNQANAMSMYGCSDADAGACLSTVPLADDTNIGTAVNAIASAHLRILYTSSDSSNYQMAVSPDGRFVARGSHVHDLTRNAEVEASPTGLYLPAFFPDNSFFVFQPSGRACPLSVLTAGTPTTVDFTGCSTTTVTFDEHPAIALNGGDYWTTSDGSNAFDDGGHTAKLTDPPFNAPWNATAYTTVTALANTGSALTSIGHMNLTTSFEGDAVISPSATLALTRVADAAGTSQVGYRLYDLNASHVGASVMASLGSPPIAEYCFKGAGATFSLDERWAVMHHYVTDDDAVDLGFTSASDPGFASYKTMGASNVYLLDLSTGARTRLTKMAPGQYAMYPMFRSDAWIYFLVRTLGTTTEFIVASDAALVAH